MALKKIGYDEVYGRQSPAAGRGYDEDGVPITPTPPSTPPLDGGQGGGLDEPTPAPPPEDPGAPPGGGDGGAGPRPQPPSAPSPPRPTMPTPRVAPPTTATPISAGSFVRPGMDRAAIAPFRSAPGMMARRPAPSAPQFGPGTPLAGGAAAPAPFASIPGETAGGAGGLTPEELLALLQGGGR